jgi:hypothetical protein
MLTHRFPSNAQNHVAQHLVSCATNEGKSDLYCYAHPSGHGEMGPKGFVNHNIGVVGYVLAGSSGKGCGKLLEWDGLKSFTSKFLEIVIVEFILP